MAKASPWNKIKPLEAPQSLQDIMSEEIARDMQNKEEQKLAELIIASSDNTSTTDEIPAHLLSQTTQEYCDSDAVIAKILQLQYDRDYNAQLKKSEDKFNGTSKVSVSFSNYRRERDRQNSNGLYDDDDDSEYDDYGNEYFYENDKKAWDRFESNEREFSTIPPCGYKRSAEGGMITKHDSKMSGTRNACKVMSFPPEFQTGDGAGFDMQISNKVFNSLRAHSRTEQARRQKMSDKQDHATSTMGFDFRTSMTLFKFINTLQLLKDINGVISTGKEAVIVHCESSPAYPGRTLPKECVIKVYKTTLNEFKTRNTYIRGDYRFKDRMPKQDSPKMIYKWAEKEMNNLVRMAKIGIPCPEVVFLRENLLVMSFIGENNLAAPKLKHAKLSFEEWCDAHDQVVDVITKLYQQAHLVHADFSEYNILWFDDKCWFIDVSQAVEYEHPSAYEFLLRDCNNVYNFFHKKGLSNIQSGEELFEDIVGLSPDVAFKSQRKDKKLKPHLMDGPEIEQLQQSFDRLWENNVEKRIAIYDPSPSIATTTPFKNAIVESPKA